MSWTDWACLSVFVLGFLFFLYGANIYDAVVGYIGLYLSVGSIIAYILLYVYKRVTKLPPPQNP